MPWVFYVAIIVDLPYTFSSYFILTRPLFFFPPLFCHDGKNHPVEQQISYFFEKKSGKKGAKWEKESV